MNLFKDVELFFKNCKNCFLFKLRKTKTERGATSIRSSNESKDDQDKEPMRRQRRSLTPKPKLREEQQVSGRPMRAKMTKTKNQ